jgi:hypothetical protein
MTDDQLYNAIWETVGARIGYGVDCDVLTDQIWDIIIEDDAQTTRRNKRNQVGAFMMGTLWGRPQ